MTSRVTFATATDLEESQYGRSSLLSFGVGGGGGREREDREEETGGSAEPVEELGQSGMGVGSGESVGELEEALLGRKSTGDRRIDVGSPAGAGLSRSQLESGRTPTSRRSGRRSAPSSGQSSLPSGPVSSIGPQTVRLRDESVYRELLGSMYGDRSTHSRSTRYSALVGTKQWAEEDRDEENGGKKGDVGEFGVSEGERSRSVDLSTSFTLQTPSPVGGKGRRSGVGEGGSGKVSAAIPSASAPKQGSDVITGDGATSEEGGGDDGGGGSGALIVSRELDSLFASTASLFQAPTHHSSPTPQHHPTPPSSVPRVVVVAPTEKEGEEVLGQEGGDVDEVDKALDAFVAESDDEEKWHQVEHPDTLHEVEEEGDEDEEVGGGGEEEEEVEGVVEGEECGGEECGGEEDGGEEEEEELQQSQPQPPLPPQSSTQKSPTSTYTSLSLSRSVASHHSARPLATPETAKAVALFEEQLASLESPPNPTSEAHDVIDEVEEEGGEEEEEEEEGGEEGVEGRESRSGSGSGFESARGGEDDWDWDVSEAAGLPLPTEAEIAGIAEDEFKQGAAATAILDAAQKEVEEEHRFVATEAAVKAAEQRVEKERAMHKEGMMKKKEVEEAEEEDVEGDKEDVSDGEGGDSWAYGRELLGLSSTHSSAAFTKTEDGVEKERKSEGSGPTPFFQARSGPLGTLSGGDGMSDRHRPRFHHSTHTSSPHPPFHPASTSRSHESAKSRDGLDQLVAATPATVTRSPPTSTPFHQNPPGTSATEVAAAASLDRAAHYAHARLDAASKELRRRLRESYISAYEQAASVSSTTSPSPPPSSHSTPSTVTAPLLHSKWKREQEARESARKTMLAEEMEEAVVDEEKEEKEEKVEKRGIEEETSVVEEVRMDEPREKFVEDTHKPQPTPSPASSTPTDPHRHSSPSSSHHDEAIAPPSVPPRRVLSSPHRGEATGLEAQHGGPRTAPSSSKEETASGIVASQTLVVVPDTTAAAAAAAPSAVPTLAAPAPPPVVPRSKLIQPRRRPVATAPAFPSPPSSTATSSPFAVRGDALVSTLAPVVEVPRALSRLRMETGEAASVPIRVRWPSGSEPTRLRLEASISSRGEGWGDVDPRSVLRVTPSSISLPLPMGVVKSRGPIVEAALVHVAGAKIEISVAPDAPVTTAAGHVKFAVLNAETQSPAPLAILELRILIDGNGNATTSAAALPSPPSVAASSPAIEFGGSTRRWADQVPQHPPSSSIPIRAGSSMERGVVARRDAGDSSGPPKPTAGGLPRSPLPRPHRNYTSTTQTSHPTIPPPPAPKRRSLSELDQEEDMSHTAEVQGQEGVADAIALAGAEVDESMEWTEDRDVTEDVSESAMREVEEEEEEVDEDEEEEEEESEESIDVLEETPGALVFARDWSGEVATAGALEPSRRAIMFLPEEGESEGMCTERLEFGGVVSTDLRADMGDREGQQVLRAAQRLASDLAASHARGDSIVVDADGLPPSLLAALLASVPTALAAVTRPAAKPRPGTATATALNSFSLQDPAASGDGPIWEDPKSAVSRFSVASAPGRRDAAWTALWEKIVRPSASSVASAWGTGVVVRPSILQVLAASVIAPPTRTTHGRRGGGRRESPRIPMVRVTLRIVWQVVSLFSSPSSSSSKGIPRAVLTAALLPAPLGAHQATMEDALSVAALPLTGLIGSPSVQWAVGSEADGRDSHSPVCSFRAANPGTRTALAIALARPVRQRSASSTATSKVRISVHASLAAPNDAAILTCARPRSTTTPILLLSLDAALWHRWVLSRRSKHKSNPKLPLPQSLQRSGATRDAFMAIFGGSEEIGDDMLGRLFWDAVASADVDADAFVPTSKSSSHRHGHSGSGEEEIGVGDDSWTGWSVGGELPSRIPKALAMDRADDGPALLRSIQIVAVDVTGTTPDDEPTSTSFTASRDDEDVERKEMEKGGEKVEGRKVLESSSSSSSSSKAASRPPSRRRPTRRTRLDLDSSAVSATSTRSRASMSRRRGVGTRRRARTRLRSSRTTPTSTRRARRVRREVPPPAPGLAPAPTTSPTPLSPSTTAKKDEAGEVSAMERARQALEEHQAAVAKRAEVAARIQRIRGQWNVIQADLDASLAAGKAVHGHAASTLDESSFADGHSASLEFASLLSEDRSGDMLDALGSAQVEVALPTAEGRGDGSKAGDRHSTESSSRKQDASILRDWAASTWHGVVPTPEDAAPPHHPPLTPSTSLMAKIPRDAPTPILAAKQHLVAKRATVEALQFMRQQLLALHEAAKAQHEVAEKEVQDAAAKVEESREESVEMSESFKHMEKKMSREDERRDESRPRRPVALWFVDPGSVVHHIKTPSSPPSSSTSSAPCILAGTIELVNRGSDTCALHCKATHEALALCDASGNSRSSVRIISIPPHSRTTLHMCVCADSYGAPPWTHSVASAAWNAMYSSLPPALTVIVQPSTSSSSASSSPDSTDAQVIRVVIDKEEVEEEEEEGVGVGEGAMTPVGKKSALDVPPTVALGVREGSDAVEGESWGRLSGGGGEEEGMGEGREGWGSLPTGMTPAMADRRVARVAPPSATSIALYGGRAGKGLDESMHSVVDTSVIQDQQYPTRGVRRTLAKALGPPQRTSTPSSRHLSLEDKAEAASFRSLGPPQRVSTPSKTHTSSTTTSTPSKTLIPTRTVQFPDTAPGTRSQIRVEVRNTSAASLRVTVDPPPEAPFRVRRAHRSFSLKPRSFVMLPVRFVAPEDIDSRKTFRGKLQVDATTEGDATHVPKGIRLHSNAVLIATVDGPTWK